MWVYFRYQEMGNLLMMYNIITPSIEAFGGERGQSDFITHLSGRFTREQGIDLYMFSCAWLHDIDENDYIGLIKRNGTEKLAYEI
ncbi:MAG: hypothetical protein L6N96_02175 [Candidatus Methylarchaceae archaeon HK02M2]|nr:hypothetical protein [Candidatus Methylarchaceae archaeon HK02M2]